MEKARQRIDTTMFSILKALAIPTSGSQRQWGEKNKEFPKNYIDAMIEHMREHHNCVYLLSCHKEVRDELKARDFEYIIVMPHPFHKNEYMKRWLRRGSSEEFIRSMYDRWDSMIRSCEEDSSPKIYLDEKEYINDVLPM